MEVATIAVKKPIFKRLTKTALVFAVDFDGTIVEHDFPEIGSEKPDALRTLKALQKDGHKIIIYTCRRPPYIGPIIEWMIDRGFKPNAINKNLSYLPTNHPSKILAHVYIDDRSFPPFTDWSDVQKTYLNN
ncbi:HAD hydrolase family protein [candidate division KSB1 bacterium]|nr:HAD hydrolase family protein [candidate division KSB1 bacterium]